ncbi:MAG: class II fructose-bisphosphate aldolase [Lachnospiraceae bacterium]
MELSYFASDFYLIKSVLLGKENYVKMRRYIYLNSPQYFAFNVWSIESAKAVIDGASALKRDVILQTSMKAYELLDKEEFRVFVNSYAAKRNIHAYLHLDHCKRLGFIQEAIGCGWDSIMIDASDQSLEENIRLTNMVCKMAGEENVLVEAEVGQIAGQEDDISVTEAGIAKIEDVKQFLQRTNVDMLAVAVGTAHGLYKGIPRLRYDLIDQVVGLTDIPFVIHGGTGLSEETFLQLLSYKKIKKINISTDVKLAYRQGMQESIQSGYMEEGHFDPLKVNQKIHDAIQNMAIDKLKLLGRES